jgi:DNA-binding MarR family transcriptional regulator
MSDPEFERQVEAFHQGARMLAKAARRAEAGNGLGPSQLAVLGYLQREGPLSIAMLAQRENVTHPTMSRLVSGLERAGLVAKRPSPDDARARTIAVTDLGRSRRADALLVRVDLVRALASQLKPETLIDLVRAIERMAAQVSSKGAF